MAFQYQILRRKYKKTKKKKLRMVLHKNGINSKYCWAYIAPNNANAPTYLNV